MKQTPPDVPMESRMRWNRTSGSAGGGEETTGRKADTGASPPTLLWMYRPDHPPPRFHAQYGDEVAQIELGTLSGLNGSLPPRALRLVRGWARLHTEELADSWMPAQALEPLAPIEPLP